MEEEARIMVRVVDKNDTIGIVVKAAAAMDSDFGKVFDGKGNLLQVSFLRGTKVKSTKLAAAALIPLRDLEGFKGNVEGESGNVSILVCGGKSTEEVRTEARETWREHYAEPNAIRPTRRQATPTKKWPGDTTEESTSKRGDSPVAREMNPAAATFVPAAATFMQDDEDIQLVTLAPKSPASKRSLPAEEAGLGSPTKRQAHADEEDPTDAELEAL
jgi:hypothetical protein